MYPVFSPHMADKQQEVKWWGGVEETTGRDDLYELGMLELLLLMSMLLTLKIVSPALLLIIIIDLNLLVVIAAGRHLPCCLLQRSRTTKEERRKMRTKSWTNAMLLGGLSAAAASLMLSSLLLESQAATAGASSSWVGVKDSRKTTEVGYNPLSSFTTADSVAKKMMTGEKSYSLLHRYPDYLVAKNSTKRGLKSDPVVLAKVEPLEACQDWFRPTKEDIESGDEGFYTDISVVPISECDQSLSRFEEECASLESKGQAVGTYLPPGQNGAKKQHHVCRRCPNGDQTWLGLSGKGVLWVTYRDGQVQLLEPSSSESEPSWTIMWAVKVLDDSGSRCEELLYFDEEGESSFLSEQRYSAKTGFCCKATYTRLIPDAQNEKPETCDEIGEENYGVSPSYVRQLYDKCIADCRATPGAIYGTGCDGRYEECFVPKYESFEQDQSGNKKSESGMTDSTLLAKSCSRDGNLYEVVYKGILARPRVWYSSSTRQQKFRYCFLNGSWVEERPPVDDVTISVYDYKAGATTNKEGSPPSSGGGLSSSISLHAFMLVTLFITLTANA